MENKGVWIKHNKYLFYSEIKDIEENIGESSSKYGRITRVTLYPIIGHVTFFDFIENSQNNFNDLIKCFAYFSNDNKHRFCIASYNLDKVNEYVGDWFKDMNEMT